MGDRLRAGKLSRYVTRHQGQISLAIPLWVGALSTSLGWEGNCRSGIALAMRHRQKCFIYLRKLFYINFCVHLDAQLLEKYFRQLDEIKMLKEQVRHREKKIRRLEDQLRIFSRATTTTTATPGASWSGDHRDFCRRSVITSVRCTLFNLLIYWSIYWSMSQQVSSDGRTEYLARCLLIPN